VDGVKTWLVMWHLLLRRPLVFIFLAILYLATAVLFLMIASDQRVAAIGALGAFAAGGLTALLTERVARYCTAAGSLGIPGHARTLRNAQALFLILFIAIPGAGAWAGGAPLLPTAAVLLGATAAGIVLSTYRLWWLMLVPTLARSASLWHWLNLPVTQAATVAASAWLIGSWLQLPRRRERVGEALPLRLSDSRHERAVGQPPPAISADAPPEPQRQANQPHESHPPPEVIGSRAIRLALAMALGYSVHTNWRQVLYGATAGLIALGVWHLLRGASEDSVSYTTVCAVCCFTVVARLQSMLSRWERTSVEQAILRITPLWPRDSAVKRAVLQSTFHAQLGTLAAWALLSAAAWLLDLISGAWVFTAAAALAGTCLAFSASLWATLARRQIREWHLFTILAVIIAGIGAVITAFRPARPAHLALGIAIMLVPPAAAVLWYLLAPLRVPVSVDARALRLAD
jgi:hypothetical protein